MIKIVRKLFWLWQFDKEEAWLNVMSAQGWQLESVGFCRYQFRQGTSGKYIYKLELLDDLPGSQKGRQYIEFLESTGVEQVSSMMRWVYFRKLATDGPFELFSDLASRMKHLNRMLALAGVVGGVNLFNTANQLHSYLANGYGFHLTAAIICALAAALLGWGFCIIAAKKNRLKKESQLHE